MIIRQNSKRQSWRGLGSRCVFPGIIAINCNALKYVWKVKKVSVSCSVQLFVTPWTTALVAQTVNNQPALQGTQVWYLGREDPLEKEMVIHSSILAWEISWTEEPGGQQSIGLQRVGQDWVTNNWSPRTAVGQDPLPTECSWQEYWSGLPFPSPVDLPGPRIEPMSPTLQADSLLSKPPGKPKICLLVHKYIYYLA